jgi:hypothetical protein
MAKSIYFPQYGGRTSEQTLVQDLVDEQIKLFGQDVIYIPKTMLIDTTLNDVILSKFEDKVTIEMMLINVEGFGGSGAVAMSKFGLKLSDEVTYAVSKRRWVDYVETEIDTKVPDRPNEGDLLYVPMTKNIYEIKFVEREVPFYQLGKNYIFSLTCELFDRSDSFFDTGDDEIDSLTPGSYVFPVSVKTGGTGAFVVGEEVTQSYTPTGTSTPVVTKATVAEWIPSTRKLRLTYINGVLKENIPLVGQDSAASWVVDTFSSIDFDIDNYNNDQNEVFETTANTIIDFTEGNPFGEYGNKTGSF